MLLSTEPDIEIVGLVGTEAAALEVLAHHPVDVVIMDYDLKVVFGHEVIRSIKSSYPAIHVLALTSYDEKGVIRTMVEAGAISYMLKDAEREELVAAVRSTAKGLSWFSQDISRILLQDILPNNALNRRSLSEAAPSELTPREIEVLKLIVAEKTNKEIAEILFISSKTVENHRNNLMQKIAARNTAGLVKYALRHRIAE
jgi:DNA-binding NarL/FixJ family response regulator